MNNMNATLEEETILTSNDGSVILTNKRLIQDEERFRKELDLKDILAWEVTSRPYRYYIALSVFFGLLTTILAVSDMASESPSEEAKDHVATYLFLIVLTSLAVLIASFSRKRYLKVRGRFGIMFINIKQLNKQNLAHFISRLEEGVSRAKR